MIPTYIFLPFIVVTGLAADIRISATDITDRGLGAEALFIPKLATCVQHKIVLTFKAMTGNGKKY